ncbi:aldehyde dehydrogenase [Brevibacterium sp. VCM10]|uniref:aldehyde dehydrogenase n=1 Tax=Brevibacterium sp. VCM10 TaxID=1381751 RepID=UPI0004B1B8D3|nr:aldehyde dehydrogenase [Brevibacterium sp. VCM10]
MNGEEKMTEAMWQGNYGSLFVGGEWLPGTSGEKLEVVSPYTEQTIAEVPLGSNEDIDRAVAAARRAFDEGPWPKISLDERIAVVERLAAEMKTHELDMATLVTAEMGTPIAHSVPIQAERPRRVVEEMIEVARTYPFDEIREAATGRAKVTRTPKGVLAAMVPWNAPHLITMYKLTPALLTGCTVVVKCSPEAPLDQYLLAEMATRAGVPAGVINFVPARRGPSQHLVQHPGVDMVSFTGSSPVGKDIASKCAPMLRPCTLELGGKSAALVLDDVDVDTIANGLIQMAYRSNGEVCTAKTRFILPRSRSQEVIEAMKAILDELKIGDPFDDETYFGPLVSSGHRDRVAGMIERAIADGATPVVGGAGRPEGLDTGWFVRPTLFTNVERDFEVHQDEVFGPVGIVLEYDTLEEGIEIANDSQYGLSGSVFSQDVDRAVDAASRIDTGMVEVNGNPAGIAAPFGGWKDSGIGYELGSEGFDDLVMLKSIGLPR